MPKRSWFSVMVGQKTTRSKPRTLKSLGTEREALRVATEWRDKNPGRVVGVYKVSKVKLFASPKQRRRGRILRG